jgi:undecaprenyl-diphosphatase
LQIAATAVAGVLIYKLLKHFLVRERPYISHGAIQLGAAPLDRYSCPSGHTLHAVSFTLLFGHVEPVLSLVALPFAVLVALSRVILGLHYPSDVLVGAAIGITLAQISIGLA